MKKLVMVLIIGMVLTAGLAIGHMFAKADVHEAAPSETAVLTGVAADGATIPLPTYQDGSTAAETDCHWIVAPNNTSFTELGHQSNTVVTTCETQGRVVRCFTVRDGSTTVSGTANYMIIAVRSADAVPSSVPFEDEAVQRSTSWGAVKSDFRK